MKAIATPHNDIRMPRPPVLDTDVDPVDEPRRAPVDVDPRLRRACAVAPRLRWLVVPVLRLVLAVLTRGRFRRDVAGLPARPVVVAANHASHVDTMAVVAAWPRPLVVAAAQDHFFRPGPLGRLVGAFLGSTIGAWPFPRSGTAGLDRVRWALDRGLDVLVFPQGTRGGGPVKAGVPCLSEAGATVVAVRLDGPGEILPKGTAVPSSAPLRLQVRGVVPARTDVAPATRMLTEQLGVGEGPDVAAVDLAGAGPLDSPSAPASETTSDTRASVPLVVRASTRMRATADGLLGQVLVAVWAFAEAFAWPLVPDAFLAAQVFAAPRRTRRTLLIAVVAAGLGASAAVVAARHGLVWPMPLTTPAMADAATTMVADEGLAALRHQPLSGIPVKVFNVAAADTNLGAMAWGAVAALARGARMAVAAGVAAAAGRLLLRVRDERRRATAHLLTIFVGTVALLTGLVIVVQRWSAPLG